MKKISIYFLLLCAGMMVASCVEPLTPQPGRADGTYGINLSTVCIDPDTKATMPGEEKYNENTINRIDWFVFKGSETVPVVHGRTSSSDTTVLLDAFVGTASSISGTVYVIANLPTNKFKHDITKGILQSTDGGQTWGNEGALTKSALEALKVAASFNALDENKKFKAQDEFVMSGETTFSLTSTAKTQTVTASLIRLAAKITLDLSVVPAIDEVITLPNGQDTYVKTWYPELDKIQVYLSYADSCGKIAGTPEEYVNGAGFFTYDRNAYTSTITPTFTPIAENSDNWDNGFKWGLTGSPFYTYPLEWETKSETAPFIKIILPWTAFDESKKADGTSALIYDGTPSVFKRAGRARRESTKKGTQEFFYKIALPSENTVTVNNVNKLQLKENEWYDLVLDVTILGGSSDDLPLELAGQYYVVNWSNPDFTAGGALKQGRYLSTPRDTFYIYGGDDIEIPVSSSHALADGSSVITKREVLYNDNWINATSSTATGSTINQLKNLRNRTVSVTASSDGRSSLKLTNTLNRTLNANLDCYPMRFTLLLRHNDNQGMTHTVVVYQYPSIYTSSKPGGNAMVDGYYGNVDSKYRYRSSYPNGTLRTGNSGTTADNDVPMPYGTITRYETTQTNLTVISISSFGNNTKYTLGNNTYDYIIADPRQASGYNSSSLINYNTGSNTNTSWGNNASKIMIGNTSTPNLIAPKLFIASRWSRFASNEYVSHQNAQKRCATYQEAGYPAGRWRLPTEAEVNFIVNLQNYNFINQLFIARAFTASGSTIQVSNNQITYSTTYTTAVCRCVYDAWYWGEDPVEEAKSTYTIGVE